VWRLWEGRIVSEVFRKRYSIFHSFLSDEMPLAIAFMWMWMAELLESWNGIGLDITVVDDNRTVFDQVWRDGHIRLSKIIVPSGRLDGGDC
jgi:hypothetical protein